MRTIALAALLALASPALAQDQPPAFLGVHLAPLDAETRVYFKLPADIQSGVVLSQIVEDSPAAAAGLRAGDVVVKFDGKKINSAEELVNAVRARKPGNKVWYLVRRGPGTIEGSLVLGKWQELEVIIEEPMPVPVPVPDSRKPEMDKRLDKVQKDIEAMRKRVQQRRAKAGASARVRLTPGRSIEDWMAQEEERLAIARERGNQKGVQFHSARLSILKEMRHAGFRAPDRDDQRIERKLDAILELLKKRR
ncbi:MAG: S1C family serine protease [Planctomycetota bacterium]|jgi:hypothetical protein